jgi:hypothetical protein
MSRKTWRVVLGINTVLEIRFKMISEISFLFIAAQISVFIKISNDVSDHRPLLFSSKKLIAANTMNAANVLFL